MKLQGLLCIGFLLGVFGCETTSSQSSTPAGTSNQPNVSEGGIPGGASGGDLPGGGAIVKFRMKGVK